MEESIEKFIKELRGKGAIVTYPDGSQTVLRNDRLKEKLEEIQNTHYHLALSMPTKLTFINKDKKTYTVLGWKHM